MLKKKDFKMGRHKQNHREGETRDDEQVGGCNILSKWLLKSGIILCLASPEIRQKYDRRKARL